MRGATVVSFALLLGLQLAAQPNAPSGVVRGELLSWEGSDSSGTFQIRTADHSVYVCRFDAKTYFEREHAAVKAHYLRTGDPLEIVADRKPGTSSCYARTVQVLDPPAPPHRPMRMRTRPPLASVATDWFAPRGNLTFTGIVVRRSPDSITLRTRSGETKIMLLPDTHYLGDGLRLDPDQLKVNTHVFVRAARNIYDEIEAYQVMWGTILKSN